MLRRLRILPRSLSSSAITHKFQPRCHEAAPMTYVPDEVDRKKGILWCACGHSKYQPLCDGSHLREPVNNAVQPVKLSAAEIGSAPGLSLCGCKTTGSPPWCDGNHMDIRDGEDGDGDAFNAGSVM